MKNMKKGYVIFSAFLLALGSTACTSEESVKNVEQKVIGANNSENTADNMEEDGAIKWQLANTPSHIDKVFDDNYVVDADVHVPSISKADILSAEYMRLEEQALLEAFMQKKHLQKKSAI